MTMLSKKNEYDSSNNEGVNKCNVHCLAVTIFDLKNEVQDDARQ